MSVVHKSFSISGLPSSKLGSYLENRINTFLKKKDAGAGEVFIKVLSSTDKIVEVRPGMKTRWVKVAEFINWLLTLCMIMDSSFLIDVINLG